MSVDGGRSDLGALPLPAWAAELGLSEFGQY